jgi:hypothetical protein
MVCIRCKMVAKSELDKLGLHYKKVELGEVDIIGDMTHEQQELLKSALLKSGLELMDDKKAVLIEKIKNIIIEMVHYADEPLKTNFSDYITRKLHYDYT